MSFPKDTGTGVRAAALDFDLLKQIPALAFRCDLPGKWCRGVAISDSADEIASVGKITLLRNDSCWLFGDLPDMTAGVHKAGGTDTPGTIHWAVEQVYAARGQLLAHGIHVFHGDGEHQA